jgi:hypothetical protein
MAPLNTPSTYFQPECSGRDRGVRRGRVVSTHGLQRPELPGSASVLTWLAGLAAVWLLWRPASTPFFKPPGYTQAQHQAQMAELARIRARLPRHV